MVEFAFSVFIKLLFKCISTVLRISVSVYFMLLRNKPFNENKFFAE